MADENINDQQHRNDRCVVTRITDNHIAMCDIQSHELSINDQRDMNECQSRNDINVHSFDLVVPPIVVTKECKIQE
jgi:hypothetical protein